MIDDLIGEARLVVENQRDGILSRNVWRRDDDELVPRNAGNVFDPDDFAARNFTPHRNTVDHSGKGEIIDIPGTAGNLVETFFSGDRPANDLFPKHPAYYCTT